MYGKCTDYEKEVLLSRRLKDIYRYSQHDNVSVNDRPHVRRWSHNTCIIIQYHCVTIVYSIQYSNMLYRFVA